VAHVVAGEPNRYTGNNANRRAVWANQRCGPDVATTPAELYRAKMRLRYRKPLYMPSKTAVVVVVEGR